MRWTIHFIGKMLCVTLLSGCCAKRIVGVTQQDSVRVEVIERIEYVPDTIEVAIPYERESVVRDTTSHLENDYAMSDAAILPDGRLFHSLETRPQLRPFVIQKPVMKRDSVVYRNIYREVEVVRKAELTKFQRFQINGFWLLSILIILIFFFRWVLGRL